MAVKWQESYINDKIFCNHYFDSKEAPNIIVTHTPIVSTTVMQPAYVALDQYKVNVFAIDFTGTGKSKGSRGDFSVQSFCNDLDDVVKYIEKHYSDDIHLFGYTGIGGIFAQYYAVGSKKIKTFSQYACARYKDTQSFGIPLPLAKTLLGLMKGITFVKPTAKMSWSPPKYSGYHEELDNGFYEHLTKKYPEAKKAPMKIFMAVFECLLSSKSKLKETVHCPTLVFKTLHDRYFPREYFDTYYEQLSCKKKLVTIDDVHNIYYFKGDVFCKEVVEWIDENKS
ncbi:pimeloyl-ACP methyl ester carboxylesterase [Natranaerovirga hydrolytica]|uniref:Pimeloyl-ACP methyl ester carboxylesterase n=1 Tax=Natranaerovirga hydrolytica TaxID=680378 RepID=A0A4R1MLC6_9FIRM|nr:alpha/beta hydrolase [Natranaerovirga hydrolytica]TCK92652.1 pimeloyl-ACP methyl ester carboxylesterase [Natranaerovirga hydrolytica]